MTEEETTKSKSTSTKILRKSSKGIKSFFNSSKSIFFGGSGASKDGGMKDRSKRLTNKQGGSRDFNDTSENNSSYNKTDLSFLIEIVSCQNLPISDLTSSDPYVKVKVGKRNIHETKYISST